MLYVINLWQTVNEPEQIECIKNMIKQTGELVLEHAVYLNRQGLRNYMIQIYGQEKWAGNCYNHFRGIWTKVDQCYVKDKPIHVFGLECNQFTNVVRLKEKIRAYCQIGKSSIHTSDTKEESDQMLRLLLHKNTVHFMNTVWPDAYPYLISRIRRLAKKRDKCRVDVEDLVIVSESILTLYGRERRRKISWITRNVNHKTSMERYNKQEYVDKKKTIQKTAFLEQNIVYFWNVKFVTLDYFLEMINDEI